MAFNGDTVLTGASDDNGGAGTSVEILADTAQAWPSRPVLVDANGDGIPDATDNCPHVFNPIRPMDGGLQADGDQDGAGDAEPHGRLFPGDEPGGDQCDGRGRGDAVHVQADRFGQ